MALDFEDTFLVAFTSLFSRMATLRGSGGLGSGMDDVGESWRNCRVGYIPGWALDRMGRRMYVVVGR